MNADFVIWKHATVSGACVLDRLIGVANDHELFYGVSRLADFPVDAEFHMDLDFPYQIGITDSLFNTHMLIVASERLRQLLEMRSLVHVEYLPVHVINHKGRSAGTFHIVHPIHPVDCLDIPASGVAWDLIDPSTVDTIDDIVLDSNRIDPNRELFRIKHFPDIILVTRELAEFISASGCTGIRWMELGEF